jgi:hypothetical protein
MSWQIGLMLFCGWLVVMYLMLAIFDFVKRGDRDQVDGWDDIYEWKLRRKRDQDAARQRWGGRDRR